MNSLAPAPAPLARTGTPLVEMRDIAISFGGIRAVDNVSVDLHPGEVVGLLGTAAALLPLVRRR